MERAQHVFATIMIAGVLLVWFVLAGLSLVFVAIDVRRTPAHPVVRWAFVILTAFAGPLGAFFYVLGCREPLAKTHERYVAARWRQVLGSTMHCAAGDGLGIIAGAAFAARMHLGAWGDLTLEYALGFGFGWLFFQAFAMRDMAGGSYTKSLAMTFLPEFLSMNLLMAGMVATMAALGPRIGGGGDPARPEFWFVMSMSLIVGFGFAYPINGWLVARGLKHGMFTVREGNEGGGDSHGEMRQGSAKPSAAVLVGMTALSILFLAVGIAAARLLLVASPLPGLDSLLLRAPTTVAEQAVSGVRARPFGFEESESRTNCQCPDARSDTGLVAM